MWEEIINKQGTKMMIEVTYMTRRELDEQAERDIRLGKSLSSYICRTVREISEGKE